MKIPEYIKAVSDSLYCSGNNFRLRKALEKKKVSLVFAGGSITKGWDGTKHLEKNYTDYITDYLREKYSGSTFEKHNLSTESANSFIGLSITDKVREEVSPDIVFIEYAVNNECGHEYIVSYESLVRRMLSLPSEPAVVLVFLISRSLYTSQGYMKRIGNHYGLISVSVADSMKNMLDNGFSWSVYSDDMIHPNPWGHRFIADCLINSFEQVLSREEDSEYSVPAVLYSHDYADYRTCSCSDVSYEGFEKILCPEYGEFFSSGLSMKHGEKAASVSFEGKFRTLFTAFVHDKTDRFSDADIYIDGEKKAILQGRSIYGWGNVTLKNVISFDTAENHKVELKVRDTKKEFVFIEFGIS